MISLSERFPAFPSYQQNLSAEGNFNEGHICLLCLKINDGNKFFIIEIFTESSLLLVSPYLPFCRSFFHAKYFSKKTVTNDL